MVQSYAVDNAGVSFSCKKMGEVGRARFHDGRPEFERADPKAVAPLSHGKVMAAFTADKEHCTCCKIVMLSRFNLSRCQSR